MTEKLSMPEGNESQSSRALALEAVSLAESLVGSAECTGDQPYEIKFLDRADQKGYIIEIRMGAEWVTISLQVSDNPQLKRYFRLENKNSIWEYDDPYFEKYGEPSTDKLEIAVNVLRKAVEMLEEPSLETERDRALPPLE